MGGIFHCGLYRQLAKRTNRRHGFDERTVSIAVNDSNDFVESRMFGCERFSIYGRAVLSAWTHCRMH